MWKPVFYYYVLLLGLINRKVGIETYGTLWEGRRSGLGGGIATG